MKRPGRPPALTEQEVKELRALYRKPNVSFRDLAKKYNKHIKTVHDAVHKRGPYANV